MTKKNEEKQQGLIESVSGLCDGLANPTRLAIFFMLQGVGPMCQGAIAKEAGLSQSTGSFHLALMERAGLLLATRRGKRQRFYEVNREAAARLGAFIADLMA